MTRCVVTVYGRYNPITYLIYKKDKQKYSYHYMNKDKEMIFRYDNVQHHRNIKTFPHHKHTPNNIVESKEPTLKQILNEVEQHIIDE